jgi:hypothetical protein
MHKTVCSVLLVVLYANEGLVGGWVPFCQCITTNSMLIGANSTQTCSRCAAVHAPINPVTGIFCIVLNSLDSSYSC